jgi:uncharacterized protein YxeA
MSKNGIKTSLDFLFKHSYISRDTYITTDFNNKETNSFAVLEREEIAGLLSPLV